MLIFFFFSLNLFDPNVKRLKRFLGIIVKSDYILVPVCATFFLFFVRGPGTLSMSCTKYLKACLPVIGILKRF